MTPTDTRAALADCEEAQAANDLEQLRIYNPSPEVDSLLERVVALRDYGVPAAVIAELLDDVRVIVSLNRAERGHEQRIAGRLDYATRSPERTLGVKSLAAELRGLLDAAEDTGPDGVRARVRILDMSRAHAELFAARSLPGELGMTRMLQLRVILDRFEAAA